MTCGRTGTSGTRPAGTLLRRAAPDPGAAFRLLPGRLLTAPRTSVPGPRPARGCGTRLVSALSSGRGLGRVPAS